MATLRARLDVILVVEQDDTAVQFEFFTTLKDQLELTKRFPKIADTPNDAPPKLIYCAAIRVGAIPPDTTYDQFVEMTLDLQIDEAPPLVRKPVSQDS